MRTLGVPPGVLVCTAEVGGLERFLPPTGCYAGLCRGLDRRPLRSDELSRLVRSELRIRRPKFESFVAIELSEHEMTPTDRPPGVQFVLRTGRCTHSSGDVRGVSSEIASTTLGARSDRDSEGQMTDVLARDLRALTRGQVLAPRDDGYESARAAYNALATGRPAYIFRPADVPDIVAAVRWAVESDLAIGVRGGAHSVAGHSSPEGALLVDLSRWRGATVDPVAQTADALGG